MKEEMRDLLMKMFNFDNEKILAIIEYMPFLEYVITLDNDGFNYLCVCSTSSYNKSRVILRCSDYEDLIECVKMLSPYPQNEFYYD